MIVWSFSKGVIFAVKHRTLRLLVEDCRDQVVTKSASLMDAVWDHQQQGRGVVVWHEILEGTPHELPALLTLPEPCPWQLHKG